MFTNEFFLFGIYRQHWAHSNRLFGQVHLVGSKMFEHSVERVHQLGIVTDFFFNLIGRHLPAKSIGNISHVAQSCGCVTDFDIGMEIAYLSTANCINKVLKMSLAAATCELLDFIVVIVIYPATTFAGSKVTTFTLHNDANTRPTIVIHSILALDFRQTTNLKNNRGWLVIVECNLSIRSLSYITNSESAADANHMLRQLRVTQSPA